MSVNGYYSGSVKTLDSNYFLDSVHNEGATTMTIYGTLPRRKQYNKKSLNGSTTNELLKQTSSPCSLSSQQLSTFKNPSEISYSNSLPMPMISTPNKHGSYSKRRGGKRRFHNKRAPLINSSASSSSRSSIATSSSGIFSMNSNQGSGVISPPLFNSENTSSAASSTDYSENISLEYDNILSDELNAFNFNGYQDYGEETVLLNCGQHEDLSSNTSNRNDYSNGQQKFPSMPYMPNFNDPIVLRCFQEQKKFYKQIYEQQFACLSALSKAYKQRIQQKKQDATANNCSTFSHDPSKLGQHSKFANTNINYSMPNHIAHQHLGLPPLPPPFIFPRPQLYPSLYNYLASSYQSAFENNTHLVSNNKPQIKENAQNLNIESNLSKEQIRDIMLDRMLGHKSLRRSPTIVATTPVCQITSSPIQSEHHLSAPKRNAESGYHSESPSPPAPTISLPQTNPSQQQTIPNVYYDSNEISRMDVLSEQIYHFHTVNAQTQFTLNRKLELRDMLYYAIQPIFPMCGLYVVGSSLNGFGTNNSDMDLCLMLTSKDLDQKTDAITVLRTINDSLSKTPFVRNQLLIDTAKVPILRLNFEPPFNDITVDLNANNSVAIRNTHLLCYYATYDWRVRPLVAIVKEWAKQRGINESTRSSFTSYSLVLMVINFLQHGVDPPVLPSLQKLYPSRFHNKTDIRTLNVSVPLEIPPQGKWKFSNTMSLSELLIGFLEYYSMRYENSAISVRMGKTINRHKMSQEQHLQWSCILIEEPFMRTNTAHSVYNEMIFEMIKQTFYTSYLELNKNRDFESFMNVLPLPIMPTQKTMMITSAEIETTSSCTTSDLVQQEYLNQEPE